jgi:hypothetical protein
MEAMKAVEFEARLNEDGTLSVPAELIPSLKQAPFLKIILLFPAEDDEKDWARLTVEQFAQGYVEADSIYDQL